MKHISLFVKSFCRCCSRVAFGKNIFFQENLFPWKIKYQR